MLPKLKKRITSFLVGEEGKISKQSLLSLGAFIGTGVLGGILAAKDASAQTYHTNSLSLSYSGGTATATHGHHSSHSSSSDSSDSSDSGDSSDSSDSSDGY